MLTVDYDHCTGCRACEQRCPKSCIQMIPDKYGFLLPKVDKSACIDCHLCEQVCPIAKPVVQDLPAPKVYASYLKDAALLRASTSGGMFPALARLTFEKNGIVYGCAWDESLKAVQIRITNEADLWRLQGSKYVQSDTGSTYQMVQKDLQAGQYVLYTGTPCQIHGLKLFLRREYETLLTADLICHGTPSPALFRDYISWLGNKRHGKIVAYNFRDKSSRGWSHILQYCYMSKNKRQCKSSSADDDPYNYYFQKGSICRISCYTCQYAASVRVGDFTIGDFWGVEHFHPQIPTEQGISVLFANSSKAIPLMERLQHEIHLEESTLENAAKFNHQLVKPVQRTSQRDSLMEAWRKSGFNGIYKSFRRERGIKPYLSRIANIVLTPKMKEKIKRILSRRA